MVERSASESLVASWRIGREAWPKVDLPLSSFGEFVNGRDLVPEHAADVYLACACARGLPAAVEAFEVSFAGVIERAIRRAPPDGPARDDLRQMIRAHLFVTGESGPGKIASYSGRAPLEHWVRVVASRVIRSAQRKRTDLPAEDRLFMELVEGRTAEDAVIEAGLVKTYKAAFERAFHDLAPEAQTILRLSVVEGLGVSQLAQLLDVHRATAARRLAAAREQLSEAMLARLKEDATLSRSAVRSALRLIQSRIDLSLERVMRKAQAK